MSRLAIAEGFAFCALRSALSSAALIAWDKLQDNPALSDFGVVTCGAVLSPFER